MLKSHWLAARPSSYFAMCFSYSESLSCYCLCYRFLIISRLVSDCRPTNDGSENMPHRPQWLPVVAQRRGRESNLDHQRSKPRFRRIKSPFDTRRVRSTSRMSQMGWMRWTIRPERYGSPLGMRRMRTTCGTSQMERMRWKASNESHGTKKPGTSFDRER